MELITCITRVIVGALFSSFLAGRGLRKRSLDHTGAASAWLVGFIACLGGGRNWEQVLANALTGSVISILYLYSVGFNEISFGAFGNSWSTSLLAAYIGHYACCNGDTWASELGILSKQAPRLITTFRKVPPGTNGGITFLGCAASTIGGFVIGLSFFVVDFVLQTYNGQPTPALLPLLFLGTASGITGSLVDSLLGATVQWSGYSEAKKKVVNEPAPGVKHICGRNILNNHHVNFVSSLITSIIAGLFATLLF